MRPGPALKGFALLAAACGALAISHDHFVVVLVCAAVMLLLGAIWPLVLMADVRLSVSSAPARSRVGEAVAIRLHVRRGWLRAAVAGVRWHVPVGLELADAPRTLPARSQGVELAIGAGRRGIYPIGEIAASTSFPFGLIEVSRRVQAESTLIVWPAPAEVEPAQLARAASMTLSTSSAERGSGDGDVSGLRPYRRGDALRAVSWRQTARFGQLIVRERSGSTAQRAVHATLDTCADHYGDGDGDGAASFERAVSLFAGLADACLRERIVLHARVATASRADAMRFVVAEDSARTALFDALAAATLHPAGVDAGKEAGVIIGPRGLVFASNRQSSALRERPKASPRRAGQEAVR